MARRRSFSLGAAAAGAIAMLVLLAAIATVVVLGGLYPVAASSPHSAGVRLVFESAMHNAVKNEAGGIEAPRLARADVLEGGSHFKGMCQQCHGGPGAEPEQFATVMNPNPPELTHAAREWSQEEIFWIAKHGIKMTGMPAFGQYASDEELWKIAAFVEQLPNVGAGDYAALPDAHAEESGGDGHSH